MFGSWRDTRKRARNLQPLRPSRRVRFRLEELEARNLPSVYTPAQMVQAYGFNQVSFNGVPGDGRGQTIAIVDAYDSPNIQKDVSVFSSQFNLPQMNGANGDPTLTVKDFSNGVTDPTGGWELETALDVEWAHAIAPQANILLVQAASQNQNSDGAPVDLLNAVQYAAQQKGVVAVSMSWGVNEFPNETKYDSYFTTPGVTFVAASGDSGALAGTIWPSVSPNVVSVGGTTLRLGSAGTNMSESGWGNDTRWSGGIYSYFFGGGGGGYSQYESEPAYQMGVQSSGVRTNPDVAYDANLSTGVYVYDQSNGGWNAVGGTSVGAPQWAALVAIADQGRAQNGAGPLDGTTQTLPALYSSSLSGDFHDITSGNNGYSARPGYDLVTGQGSPRANLLIPALVSAGPSALVSGSTASSSVATAPQPVRHRFLATPVAGDPTGQAPGTPAPVAAPVPATTTTAFGPTTVQATLTFVAPAAVPGASALVTSAVNVGAPTLPFLASAQGLAFQPAPGRADGGAGSTDELLPQPLGDQPDGAMPEPPAEAQPGSAPAAPPAPGADPGDATSPDRSADAVFSTADFRASLAAGATATSPADAGSRATDAATAAALMLVLGYCWPSQVREPEARARAARWLAS